MLETDETKAIEETVEEIEEIENKEASNEIELTVAKLRQENNLLHGERSKLANRVNGLESKIDELIANMNKTPNSDLGEDDEYVTKAELKRIQGEEPKRYENWLKTKQEKESEYTNKYTESFAKTSSDIEDDTLAEIVKEHDRLATSGILGKTTGDPEIDARIAYKEAENSYLRKLNSEGKVMPFKKTTTKKPLGVGNPEGDASPKKKPKLDYSNLPDDAREFIQRQGLDDEFVRSALGSK